MEGLFDWIAQSTPSLLSWWIGLGVAVASLWVGLSGLYRRLRGRQPHPMVANPWWLSNSGSSVKPSRTFCLHRDHGCLRSLSQPVCWVASS